MNLKNIMAIAALSLLASTPVLASEGYVCSQEGMLYEEFSGAPMTRGVTTTTYSPDGVPVSPVTVSVRSGYYKTEGVPAESLSHDMVCEAGGVYGLGNINTASTSSSKAVVLHCAKKSAHPGAVLMRCPIGAPAKPATDGAFTALELANNPSCVVHDSDTGPRAQVDGSVISDFDRTPIAGVLQRFVVDGRTYQAVTNADGVYTADVPVTSSHPRVQETSAFIDAAQRPLNGRMAFTDCILPRVKVGDVEAVRPTSP